VVFATTFGKSFAGERWSVAAAFSAAASALRTTP
jgi:hypothetical protein